MSEFKCIFKHSSKCLFEVKAELDNRTFEVHLYTCNPHNDHTSTNQKHHELSKYIKNICIYIGYKQDLHSFIENPYETLRKVAACLRFNKNSYKI